MRLNDYLCIRLPLIQAPMAVIRAQTNQPFNATVCP